MYLSSNDFKGFYHIQDSINRVMVVTLLIAANKVHLPLLPVSYSHNKQVIVLTGCEIVVQAYKRAVFGCKNQVTLKSEFFRNRKRSFNTNNVKFFHHLLCVSVNLGMYRFSFPTASSQTILLFCTTNKFRNIQEINKTVHLTCIWRNYPS